MVYVSLSLGPESRISIYWEQRYVETVDQIRGKSRPISNAPHGVRDQSISAGPNRSHLTLTGPGTILKQVVLFPPMVCDCCN